MPWCPKCRTEYREGFTSCGDCGSDLVDALAPGSPPEEREAMKDKARKWWVALLLSLVQPGLGQIYNGQFRKAIIMYALPLLIFPGVLLCLNSAFVRAFLVAFVILTAAYYLWAAIDAVRTSRRLSRHYVPKKYNKLVVYIGAFLIVAIVANVISQVVKSNLIQAYKFPSTSMEPSVLMGDHILVDRREPARHPRRGDLVVFSYPEDESKDFLQRVVAVPGDTIEIKDKQLIINGRPLQEPYAIHIEPSVIPAPLSARDNFGPFTVPATCFFVLGDNRDRSLDSRFFGVVGQSKVKGTVKSIYWSWDSREIAVRWERIGKEVR